MSERSARERKEPKNNEQPQTKQPINQAVGENNVNIHNKTAPLGYFINIGATSSRLFEIINKETLKEITKVSYHVDDPNKDEYLDGIIHHIKNEILPKMEDNTTKLLRKVFVDHTFNEIFNSYDDDSIRKDFVRDFYRETNLYFNILTKKQTTDNVQRRFGNVPNKTAIINIGSQGVDVYVFADDDFTAHSLDITLRDVQTYVENQEFPEIWDDNIVSKISRDIKSKVSDALKNITVERAIIIKGEYKFMREMNYPLTQQGGQHSLSQRKYKDANKNTLYNVNYKEMLISRGVGESELIHLYKFKYGHIIIETILDIMKNKQVIPSDELSIHGDINAYVFNVVLAGSTNEDGVAYMFKARSVMEHIGATVISPAITSDGKLARAITPDTEYDYLKAIDDCDVLLVCNNRSDGYLGESTQCEIYYAYALRKTVAFWREPPADKRLSFIPREHWGIIIEELVV